MLAVSIVGASGYVGGELLRLLLDHPEVTVQQATSERLAGQYIHTTHPNLRGRSELRYVPQRELSPCDVLILALPHGSAAQHIEHWASLGTRIIDCSADFRLRDAAQYRRWYGEDHAAAAWLERFTYGLPELQREAIRTTRYVSGVGCNATAVNLALLPLVRAGIINQQRPIIAEIKVGSSEAGAVPNEGSHHAERAGVVRSFAPVGHRHTAEVQQESGVNDVHLSITSVEMVRGALATCHVFVQPGVSERDLWRAYRAVTSAEPFLRLVHDRSGIHRHPEPKILAGSNYADLGWALDETSGRVVALCALDNLMKGAAGSAVQCLNLMCGFDEGLGLGFAGLHPA